MPDFYLKSGQASERVNSEARELGNKMVPARANTSTNHLIAKRWVWECTVAGTTGAAVPTWPATVTQDTTTVTDGTVTWTARKPGFSSGSTANWTFSSPFLDYLLPGTVAGDRIFVSQAHNETVTLTAAITYTFPGTNAAPTLVLCVNDGATPPTALATGALINTSGSFGATFSGVAYLHGIRITVGTGSSSLNITWGGTDQSFLSANQCEIFMTGTNGANRLALGVTTATAETSSYFRNCGFRFAAAGQGIEARQHDCTIEGGSIVSGGTAITTLFPAVSSGVDLAITGFDFSLAATTANIVASAAASIGRIVLRNCRAPSGWSGTLAGGNPLNPQFFMGMYGTDSGGTQTRLETRTYAGQVLSEATIVRSGGAPVAWRMVATGNVEFPAIPLISPEIYFYNTTVGSPVTVTVEVITNNVTLTNLNIWLDVMAMNTASSTLGSWTSSASALLSSATNLPSSSESWTTTGLTTPVRQKLSVTFTPQVVGDFIAIVRLARASTTVYVDPAAVVT